MGYHLGRRVLHSHRLENGGAVVGNDDLAVALDNLHKKKKKNGLGFRKQFLPASKEGKQINFLYRTQCSVLGFEHLRFSNHTRLELEREKRADPFPFQIQR